VLLVTSQSSITVERSVSIERSTRKFNTVILHNNRERVCRSR
jgi:hypothetical protein